jgi:hypothetical protein
VSLGEWWHWILARMLFGEHASMNNFFLEYFIDVNKIFWENYLTHGIEYLVMWRNILSCVHG